jgi:hypothetical protein
MTNNNLAIFNFSGASEVDVREDLLAPLLHLLGYERDGKHNLRREMPLRYLNDFIGRKKKKDSPLLGFAEYVLEANGQIRWTLEAKPPLPITQDDLDQAFSYARHPNVNGHYFVLCNGLDFYVYQTAAAPSGVPVLEIPVRQIGERFQEIAGLLSPISILRDFPLIQSDSSPPLAPGLRSVAKVVNGYWRIDESKPEVAVLDGMEISVQSGVIQRYDDASIGIVLQTRAPYVQIQELNEQLGYAEVEMRTADSTLSVDPFRPTVFEMERKYVFPAGSRLYDLTHHKYVNLDHEMRATASAMAKGSLDESVFAGSLISLIEFSSDEAQVFSVASRGVFSIQLA